MGNKFRNKEVEEGLETPKVAEPQSDLSNQDILSNQSAQEASRPRKSGKAARGLGKVLGGDVLADRMVLKQIPLVLLCLVYLLLIVGNRYRVERLSREKAATEERINYLREHRIQMQKQYQQSVKISQIAEVLKENGVGITSGPPYEL